MEQKDSKIDQIIISYKLTSRDIFGLIFSIHYILLCLPVAFLAGYISLKAIGHYGGWQAVITFGLFVLSFLAVLYFYLAQYNYFKKAYFFDENNNIYYAELSSTKLTIYQSEGKNLTEYLWTDFNRCKETKKAYYFYFRYDRALIIKKQLFIRGTKDESNELIKHNISRFK